MTRGRKKDLTIPPTRALVQQRDYRARKAKYVTDLEERCRRAEEENAQLRKDLELARAGLAVPAVAFNPEITQTSTELMHNLAQASVSLARFQQLAFAMVPPTAAAAPSASPLLPTHTNSPPGSQNNLRPASFPSPAPSSTVSDLAHAATPRHEPRYAHPQERLPRILSPPPHRWSSPRHISRHHSLRPEDSRSHGGSRSPSPESDCCGGIMDCRELVENNDDRNHPTPLPPISRLSGLRSTSEREYSQHEYSRHYYSHSNDSEGSMR
ncbi:hypothetical protein AX16_010636 [Volvariella volvacea WC 439]|nr:hypothetical protein AX16_010636 [Volvariella volvacea WC 439]